MFAKALLPMNHLVMSKTDSFPDVFSRPKNVVPVSEENNSVNLVPVLAESKTLILAVSP